MQESRNIARALGYSDDLDGERRSSIDNQVSAYRPEQDWEIGEVFAFMTHARRSTERIKRVEEFGHLTVGGIDTI